MFLFGLNEGRLGGLDPLVLLLVALALDALVGDMRPLFRLIPHPVVVIGGLIDRLERKLNRDTRSAMDRAVRGLLTVAVVVTLCGSVGVGIAWIGQNAPWGWAIELFGLTVLVAQRGLFTAARNVGTALQKRGLDAGREEVANIVGRDPYRLDQHGVARAAIESLAENFNDAVVAPVFWYVLFGFPGILVYKAVNTMDSMIGHKSERFRAFGMVAARLDDVLNLIPARLSGLFIALAAVFVPTARPWRALSTMLRHAGRHRSPNAGWPEGAMAGALDLALAGPRHYREGTAHDLWIGDGRARATPADIARALYLFWVACLINGLVVATLWLVRLGG